MGHLPQGGFGGGRTRIAHHVIVDRILKALNLYSEPQATLARFRAALGTTTDALSAGFAKLTLSFGTFAVLNEWANEFAHCGHSVEEMM